MHPAFSVIFLTTLIGVGQGLFLALYATEIGGLTPATRDFFAMGSIIAVAFVAAGLLASFFHLGRPERAWRAAACWKTSWLSREVIVLPLFMFAVLTYGVMHYLDYENTRIVGAVGVVLCFALFVCTGMIYACIRFIQEWATPLTLVNFMVLGCASGCMLAAAYALFAAPALTDFYAQSALVLTGIGLLTRVAALARNARIRPRSTIQTAIGVKHPRIEQKSQGFIGSSFNTREFFHGRSAQVLRGVKWSFLILVFFLPIALLTIGVSSSKFLAGCAFLVQYVGLVIERWFFFAQANHPQNIYYQQMS